MGFFRERARADFGRGCGVQKWLGVRASVVGAGDNKTRLIVHPRPRDGAGREGQGGGVVERGGAVLPFLQKRKPRNAGGKRCVAKEGVLVRLAEEYLLVRGRSGAVWDACPVPEGIFWHAPSAVHFDGPAQGAAGAGADDAGAGHIASGGLGNGVGFAVADEATG